MLKSIISKKKKHNRLRPNHELLTAIYYSPCGLAIAVVPIEYLEVLEIQAANEEEGEGEVEQEVQEVKDGDRGMSRNDCMQYPYTVFSSTHSLPPRLRESPLKS